MKIIIGHTNMDLDCLASMTLARYLYPDHQLVRSRLIHPVAANLYNLYQYRLNLLRISEIKEETIEEIVVVDTRSLVRIREYLEALPSFKGDIVVYDHHPADSNDIPGARIVEGHFGANVTILGLQLIERGISIEEEDATIALTGLFADTGNFTHENVTPEDFRVSSYLMESGASIPLIRKFLQTLKEEKQVSLFHELLNRLVYRSFHGHAVILAYAELEKQSGGLAAVVEKIFDVEDQDAIFAVFHLKKENRVLIIARSQRTEIPVNTLLKKFGGGGHSRAASAMVKKREGRDVYRELEDHLDQLLSNAVTASDLMTRDVCFLSDTMTLKEASIYLETINHTGAPVLDDRGKLLGMMTLRDIMKGRKSDQMHAPVKAYMTREKLISCSTETTLREIETLFYSGSIGHLPVLENGRVVGIVTRSDFLRYYDPREVM